MSAPWPKYPDEVEGGDEPTFSPAKSQNSLLGADPVTGVTRRIMVGADGGLWVNVKTTPPSLITGTWKYYSGVSGTVVVAAGERVIGISAHCTVAGSVTINGGSPITIPSNVSLGIEPNGNLTAPTIVFSGTDTYIIEVVY